MSKGAKDGHFPTRWRANEQLVAGGSHQPGSIPDGQYAYDLWPSPAACYDKAYELLGMTMMILEVVCMHMLVLFVCIFYYNF